MSLKYEPSSEQVYVVGGFDGTRDLDLVDRLDLERGFKTLNPKP